MTASGPESERNELSSPRISKRWEPYAVHTMAFIALVVVHLCFIIGIAVLLVLSNTRFGFIGLEGQTASMLGFDVNRAFLWTILPSLFFRLFSLFWDWVAEAVRDRQ